MAGGKQTPRQKMIGMMYLVLTALLALNVSKQIIRAFITINDKLETSAEIINNKNEETYAGFDQKRAALIMLRGDMHTLNEWNAKADQLKSETANLVGFLLGECNEMIKTSEGINWIAERDQVGNITKLRSLHDIEGMDNYDIPTNIFVGGNPNQPKQRGLDLRLRIHEYRDLICGLMGTYTFGENNWEFIAPVDISGLSVALESANPKDTARLSQYYRSLTIPSKLYDPEEGEMPWASVTFDHAPIVAAAAMFTSLKLDIKNSESMASEFMLAKVDAPIFDFNKIEPIPFARTEYINLGDSLNLGVRIAAYDSNEVVKIRFGIDADTASPENWRETTGLIGLPSNLPGAHRVKGQIAVREKGNISWKDWEFNYVVGQPMGVVALPEMRILYWGYNNIVEGTASGFPADRVSITGSGCTLSPKGNNIYIAKVSRGTRTARINVGGRKDDGTTVNLGSFEFECRPMPDATVYFGRTKMGGTCSYASARDQQSIRIGYDPSVPLKGVQFDIIGGQVKVSDNPGLGLILEGGKFDETTRNMLRQSRGKTVSIIVNYKDPSGTTKKGGITFTVR